MPLFTHLRRHGVRPGNFLNLKPSGRDTTGPAGSPGTIPPTTERGADPAPLFDPALRSHLRQRLLALPYRAFLQTVVRLLSAQGYQAVAPARRAHSDGRHAGGWDLEARYAADGTSPRLCVARVKQFGAQAVDLRHVDELRGAAFRAGAHEALLITLSSFSKPARRSALSVSMPVRLVDGEALLDDLLTQEIGVRPAARSQKIEDSRAGEWEVDDTYFGPLERRFAKQGAAENEWDLSNAAVRPSGGSRSGAMNRPDPSASSAPPARPTRAAVGLMGEPFHAVRVTITVTRSRNDPSKIR